MGSRSAQGHCRSLEETEINGVGKATSTFGGMVSPVRFERTTHALKGRCSTN
jgi:hypothetical protein